MPASNGEHDQVAAALSRLAIVMEQLQQRYDAAERANRRIRIVLIVVLILLGGVAYQALSPVAKLIGVVAQARPEPLDSATAAARREELLKMLPPDDRARIERFEEHQRWVSNYLAANPDFHPGAAIAMVLSQMAQSVEVMPRMHAEVSAMTHEMRSMNAKMNALPLMASDIHGMHGRMSVMAAGVDSTMGRAGRMFPWP
jgi:SpoVK/Ycf46/Vps4 family AAA+-type ATPase